MANWWSSTMAVLREGILLEHAEAAAKAYPPERAELLRALHGAAASRASVSRSLSSPRDDATAVAMMREAVVLHLRAACEARDGAPETPAEALDAIPKVTTDERQRVAGVLGEADPVFYERMSRDELAALRTLLDHVERCARPMVETRSVRMIRGTRFGRQAALALACAYLMGRAIFALTMPPDVARGKTVTASAFLRTSAPPETLVDGQDDSDVPVAVARANGAWLQVDLGREYVLSSVRLVNRTDSDFDAALPFDLEVAMRADQPWIQVARRREHFRTWTQSLDGRVARFVRVRCERMCAIGLNELDVRGHLPR